MAVGKVSCWARGSRQQGSRRATRHCSTQGSRCRTPPVTGLGGGAAELATTGAQAGPSRMSAHSCCHRRNCSCRALLSTVRRAPGPMPGTGAPWCTRRTVGQPLGSSCSTVLHARTSGPACLCALVPFCGGDRALHCGRAATHEHAAGRADAACLACITWRCPKVMPWATHTPFE